MHGKYNGYRVLWRVVAMTLLLSAIAAGYGIGKQTVEMTGHSEYLLALSIAAGSTILIPALGLAAAWTVWYAGGRNARTESHSAALTIDGDRVRGEGGMAGRVSA